MKQLNAIYIDVTPAPLRHVYNLHRYLNNSSAVKYFYDMVLNGLPAELDKAHGVQKLDRERVYILEYKWTFSNPCSKYR